MASPYVRRLRLAAELRALREKKGLSGAELAARVGLARQTVSRIENGHIRPDAADIQRILDACDLPRSQHDMILAIAADARQVGWWDADRDAMGPRQALYADLEAGAAEIREYHMTLVPGLLQVRGFTQARARADRATYPHQFDPDHALQARETRQQVVLRPDGPHYEVIIDELAIRRLAAPPAVVAAQLDHLIATGHENDHVTIRVLPITAPIPALAVPRSAFYTYRYPDPDDPVVVAVDTITSDLVLTDRSEVAHYLRLYDHLREAALPAADSLDFLVHRAEELPHETGVHV